MDVAPWSEQAEGQAAGVSLNSSRTESLDRNVFQRTSLRRQKIPAVLIITRKFRVGAAIFLLRYRQPLI
jgi:hypothetical protein